MYRNWHLLSTKYIHRGSNLFKLALWRGVALYWGCCSGLSLIILLILSGFNGGGGRKDIVRCDVEVIEL